MSNNEDSLNTPKDASNGDSTPIEPKESEAAVGVSIKGALSPSMLVAASLGQLASKLSAKTPNANQAESVSQVLQAGKDNNVKKMSVTMNEASGAHFNAAPEGAKVSVGIGKKSKVRIDVEYK